MRLKTDREVIEDESREAMDKLLRGMGKEGAMALSEAIFILRDRGDLVLKTICAFAMHGLNETLTRVMEAERARN